MTTADDTIAYYFVTPLDVLMLRGNRSFGAAGEHGEALLPPWPSLFAGAFRSALLAGDARRLAEFVAVGNQAGLSEDQRCQRMRGVLGDALFATLGTPQRPGSFCIRWASLAYRPVGGPAGNASGSANPALPLPADLLAQEDGGVSQLKSLQPATPPAGLRASASLPMTALLHSAKQLKPANGHWLDGNGLTAHLQGRLPSTTLRSDALFKRETRLGIALDAASSTASDGALYTTEAVALRDDSGLKVGLQVGFLVGIAGAAPLADSGLLRLGGDGRGACWQRVPFDPPAAPQIAQGGRFRLLLTTPGIFSAGWLPEAVVRDTSGACRLRGDGFSARLACAAMPRHEVVSGWDLAAWAPKIARRVASAGSVYWFDQFEGDAGKLATWVKHGLWPQNAAMQADIAPRRAEGLHNALLGHWL